MVSYEDRVVTTSMLREFANDTSGTLAVAAGTLQALDPNALHVLSSTGPARLPGKVMICDLRLDTGNATPCRMPVFVPASVWRRLPTCTTVIAAACRLVPEVTDEALALFLAAPEEDGNDYEPPLDFDGPIF